MTKELFDNTQFGDIFYTTENKRAVFLRFAENAEYNFAILYVEDWGTIQVFRGSGKEVHGEVAYDIIGKKKPAIPSDLDEAAEEYAKDDSYGEPDRVFTAALMGFKAGAEWMAGQGVSFDTEMSWLDSFGFQIGWPEDTSIFDCFNPGDKVVVQIRKK